jgi:hypothetical protein
VIRPGIERDSATWRAAVAALQREVAEQGTKDVALAGETNAIEPGTKFALGKAVVTVVDGYGDPPAAQALINEAERRNAGSIVVRLTYHRYAVLFAGDAVGRHVGDPPDACRAEEAEMVARADRVPIRSDVLIAPHHGADNASANCFIDAVHPDYVIFSAGHKFHHPRAVTAERYLAHGVKLDHIFRTDLGDDEGGAEWAYGREPGSVHPRGTTNVEIVLPARGAAQVRYVQER